MEIHFCDLCNESVPQADLDQGRATIHKGRVICEACDRAMTHAVAGAPASHPPTEELEPLREVPATSLAAAAFASTPEAPHARARASSGALWVAVLALALTAGAIWVIDRRIEDVTRAGANADLALGRQARDVEALRHALTRADGERAALEQRLDARIGADRRELDASLAELREQSLRVAGGLTELAAGIAGLRESAGAHELDRERRLSELAARIARGEEDQRLLVERLAEVEVTAQRAASAPPPAVAAGAASPGAANADGTLAGGPPAQPPGWMALVAELANANAGTRWEAVDGLGQTKDPLVVTHLVPMLQDPDVFVRMATARVLGDLKAKPAVPPLIDALEDGEVAVREAALFALRAITGKDLRFDPLANDSERAKRIKAWRDWWKKEQESPEASGAGEPSGESQ